MGHLFLSDNLVTSENNVTFTMVTGTENQQYPLTNILDLATTKTFRADVSAGIVEFYVDLKSIQTADTVAIVGPSTGGLGFQTMYIYGSATTDFGGSDEIEVDLSQEFNVGFKEFTSANFRYWKIKLSSTGSYAEVANLFIGEATDLGEDNGFSQSTFTYTNVTNANSTLNKYGQRFTNKYNTLQTISGTIEFLSNTDKNTLEDIFRDIGTTKPFFFITDPDNNLGGDSKYRYSGYYYLQQVPTISSINGLLWNIPLTLTQGG